MKNYTFLLLTMCFLSLSSFKPDMPAYKLFDSQGKEIKYKKMIKELGNAEIVLFGEYHNNPIAHWLELEVTKSLYDSMNGKLIMGAEMFEADNQLIIDEYMNDFISRDKFEAECRLWSNYDTDYEPLIRFAKDSAVHFVATNIPRRYASIVHKKGIDTLDKLSDEAKRFIAPLPIEFDPDSVLIAKMGGMMGKSPLPIAKAQAIKDATMGFFITKNFTAGHLFIHYNGSFHSDDDGGIRKYLQIYQPGMKVKTITTVSQEDIDKLSDEYLGKADYIICVPTDMTKTYVGMRR
ncbi:ChaN family lipoprotein [Carboxylicivirga sediminis]|uniref:ChaN family lipoprotein n=1 Tax=Carboxylicivirga sediminis TaxID=2006564 RepID=A0A941IXZ4_9BACT|nr:ChaN family lipoprotein [Carboxylicivirga sediminis]MBR8535272.1 ChaN family lipoprotein [Carboxylicivirga sediminis]